MRRLAGFTIPLRIRAGLYVAALLAINAFFVKKLFFVEFTANMQTNAGSFMAITRFILRYWPHLDWFPWWFNGQPFENSYTPMLHLSDAAFAWITGSSPAHAYNFVTAFFYVTGPVFLFLFAWRISRFLETRGDESAAAGRRLRRGCGGSLFHLPHRPIREFHGGLS